MAGRQNGDATASHEPLVATLDDLEWNERRALARIDINTPIEGGRIAGDARLRESSRTLQELIDRGAGVIVLAHQGRPGKPDFTSLEQHAEVLGGVLGTEVAFVPHIDDDEALTAASKVSPGEVLVLDNVRRAKGETEQVPAEVHAERKWVRRLAGEAEAFVLDAFSAAHRSHASLVGFPLLLPSAVGPLMGAELDALSKVTSDDGGERVLVLGGAKVEDSLKVLNHHLEGGLVDTALVGGLVGELFLQARGHKLGPATEAVLEKNGATAFLSLAEALVEKYDAQVLGPIDVAADVGGEREDLFVEALPAAHKLLDIGPETAATFVKAIRAADTVVMNGPMGAYEQEPFAHGTREVLEACKASDAFTLLGGGHTVTALEHFGMTFDDFGHVSLAGGALITYLTGDPLPAVTALEESARRFAVGAR